MAASQSFLQNPYYFMFASLAKPDEDVELHWLKVSSSLSSSQARRSTIANMHFPFPASVLRLSATSPAGFSPTLISRAFAPLCSARNHRMARHDALPARSFPLCTT